MKLKTVLAILLVVVISMGCAKDKVIDGKMIQHYGLFNEQACKDSSIIYQVSPGSVVCGIVFIETVIVPVYVIGWNLFEPVRKK